MKSNSQKRLALLLAGALIACLGSVGASASPTNMVVATRNVSAKSAPVKTPAAAGAVLPEPAPAPLSVFVIPRKMTEGKDPFFPNSTRVYGETSTKPVGATPIAADITLKGISGTAEQPLAIINTTTFTTGETSEVLLKNSRIKVQCLEINMAAGTVLLQIGAERRELRLAPQK